MSGEELSYTTTGGISFSGSSDITATYLDQNCEEILGCKIATPNKHKRCFEAEFYTAVKRNIFPKSFASTGAYLPAITACVQYLYLPSRSVADIKKGNFRPQG